MRKTILYIASIIFLFQSNFINAQWVKTSNDSLTHANSLVIHNNVILVATNDNGVYRSTDKGANWSESNNGLPTLFINKIVRDGETIYLTTPGYGIYKSTDIGISWVRIGEGFNDISNVKAIAVRGNNLFVVKDGAVIKSSNGGVSWDSVNTGLGSVDARSIFIIGNEVYTNIYDNGLYRSSIGNINWMNVSAGLSTYYRNVRSMVASPNDSNKIYIGTDEGVYFSDNGGTSWALFNNGMDNNLVDYLIFVKNNIFAGMGSGKGGVMTYSVSTSKWMFMNDGLPEYPYVNAMTADSSNIYIANSNEDFIRYRPINQITAVNDYKKNGVVNKFLLSQNYPNPFNPTTTITYTIPKVVGVKFASAVTVQLKVFNALGKEVATLVNELETPGNYKVNFDASNLSSGIYYYQLKFGNFLETKKMILLR